MPNACSAAWFIFLSTKINTMKMQRHQFRLIRKNIRLPPAGPSLDVSPGSHMPKAKQEQMTLRATLHLAHGNHLLPEIVLVVANGAVPSSDSLVLTHHDILGNLVEQSA
jgi:hypothetical protein